VDADLRQLRVAMALYHRIDNAIQHDEVYKELAERLREELDYTREAAHLRLYRLMLAGRADIDIPDPIAELSSARLLTMSWLNGVSLQSYLDTNPSLESRNETARALFTAWYLPFYRYGVIHGDPHLGNFQVRGDNGLNLLDFGAIRIFRPRFVQGVIDLQQAIERNDDEQAYHAYENWGFVGLTRDTMDVLNEWARFIYEPLLQDRVRPIQESDDPAFGRTIAEKVHAGLKRTGGVQPPREFVLLDRSAVGLGSVFLRLKASLNWHQLYHETVDGFSQQGLAARQADALAEARVPPPLAST
jgi:predicted unusual protein kinase regulating ubiquinone biosynthesis (AarF/ABC1/UbiB family)